MTNLIHTLNDEDELLPYAAARCRKPGTRGKLRTKYPAKYFSNGLFLFGSDYETTSRFLAMSQIIRRAFKLITNIVT